MELYSFLRKNEKHQRNNWNVSVSLRSYIHSYLKDVDVITELMLKPFPSPYGVIFILTKIVSKSFTTHQAKNFRLLTELYSFLLYVMTLLIKSLSHTSFRLLMEYHSFLFST